MQNASAPAQGANASWTAPPVYPNHQRQPSNPRQYEGAAPAERREEGQQAYPAEQSQYAGYQQNYGAMNYNYGVGNYSAPASGSRRTSAPKAGTPPTSSSPAIPSPGNQFYARQDGQYQPASAPPQVASHHGSISQPQTAHPYGGYYNYYDGTQQQQQWQQYPGYQRPAAPAVPGAAPEQPRSSSFDYAQNYDRSYQAPRQGSGPTQQWQGYPMQQSMQMPPGNYQWQQFPGYGYPPQAAPVAPVPPAVKKSHKKDKKEEYGGLGKREAPAEEEPEEKDKGKKKKGKKEEEKPVPKPPAKSHLHPPRQAQSAWQLFFTDELNKAKAAAQQGNSPGGTPHHAKLNVAQIAKDAGAAYANLDEEQKKYYAQKVQESKEQYHRDLAAWQKTLTPEDIRAENAFRAQQRKDGKSRKGNLKDPNAPKKPLSAYFLFLKSIREDDDLRAKVWGEETETTKQSVLAAERWRGLSDEDKRPYLSQAEKDKQDYETARKTYEEEAAARARGEDVPTREVYEPPPTHIVPPKALVAKSETFPEIEEFNGFHDPLEGMDLSGLDGIAAVGPQEGQWDELQKLMGGDDKAKAAVADEVKPEAEDKPVSEAPDSSNNTSATED